MVADRLSTDLPFGNARDLGDDVNGPDGAENRSEPSISTDERFLFLHIGRSCQTRATTSG